MGEPAFESDREHERMSLRQILQIGLGAIAPPLAAFAIESFFWPTVTRWLLFNAAVIVSSWIGGLVSGIIATVLSTALVCLFFVPTIRTVSPNSPKVYVTAGLFVAIGIAISIFHERLKRANRRVAVALANARRANEALEASAKERRIFAALIENSSDFVGIADPAGKPVYLNPAGRHMVDLPPGLPLGSTKILDYYPPELNGFVSDVIMKTMIEQRRWSGETSFRNWRTQEPIPVWDTHFMIDDPETGEVIGMATVTRDMSALKRAREALETANVRLRQTTKDLYESKELLQAVFDHSPNAIVVKDLEGRFLLTNRWLEQAFGIKSSDLRGKTDYDILPHADADRHRAADATAIETGEPVVVEESGELGDGVRTYLETVFALRDEHGKAFGVCWIGTEITEMKRAEEALQQSAAELKDAQRVAHIGNWSWDIKTDTVKWSEELFRIHGRDPRLPPPTFREELPQLFTPDSRAALTKSIEKLTKEQAPLELELETVLPDGSNRWISVRGEPIRNASGELIAVRGTSQDITQLKQLQRMKEEWMSVIAHDLRQPVGVIKMSADLLPELHPGKVDEREGAIAARIRSAANGLARMVDDLLDMSRIEAHRLSLERVWVDARATVRETVARLSHVAAKCPVIVSDDGAGSQVFVDLLRFEQILGNLISNAAKYGEPNGEIRVNVAQQAGHAKISVTNRGPGIAPEEVARLFSRFGRSKATRGSGVPGLGLGLYIAKGLVEAHGGQMWVDSVPGQTTTFHFTLPGRSAMKEAA